MAQHLSLHQAPPWIGPSCIPRRLQKAIDHCHKAFRRLRQAERDPLVHDMELDELQVAQSKATSAATQATKQFCHQLWQKCVGKAHKALLHNPRQFWRWASHATRWNLKSMAAGIQPIHDKDGVLQLEVWHDPFATLAADPTGNSQSPAVWMPIAEDETLPILASLDQDF